MKEDIDTIVKSLNEQAQLIEMKSKFQTTKYDMTKIEKLEATQENKKFEEEMVPEEIWKKASEAIPIEFHVELIQQAYDTNQR